jgi:cardiolipin synthase
MPKGVARMDLASTTTWATLYLISEWVIRLVMVVVVPFRRSPEAAKGWLLLVFFLPWPGLLLYFIIGRPTYPRWRYERFARLPEAFQLVRQRLEGGKPRFQPELPPNLMPAAVLIQNLGRLPILGGNAVELLADYDGAIDRLVADIDQAANHVHLLYYIFADDAAGGRVAAALGRAAKRGVACRVLIDFLGSRKWARSLTTTLTAAGVAVQRVLPVSLFRRQSARADLRNHRKVAVIDGRVGYTGSQNLVDAVFKPGVTYEELVARVTGPVVLELQAVFVTDWFMESGTLLDAPEVFPLPTATGPAAAQVLPSGPDYPTMNVQRLLVALVHGARERVVITTPYFIPDEALLQALETAVQRGVAVHLVVSRLADQLLVSLAQRSYYAELLRAGVRIHRYRDKFLHAKHLSIDDTVTLIGSSNMDIRSFVLNAEVSLVCYDPSVTARLRAEQERYFAGSDLLLPEEWDRRSLPAKVSENLARLMSPLL